MNKVDIAKKAAEIIGGDRATSHGPALENHAKIAAVWNGILKAAGKHVELDAHDVANLMEGLKIARRYLGGFNVDDYVDGCGYAACAGEIRSKMEENNQTWAYGGIIEVPSEDCIRCGAAYWQDDKVVCCKESE